MGSWRRGTLAKEAFLNVVNGGLKSLASLLLVLACLLFSGLADANAVRSVASAERRLVDAGGYALVVSPPQAGSQILEAAACERLGGRGPVLAAGAVISSALRLVTQAPGTRVRILEVTPGLLIATRMGPGSVLIGRSLADELGLGPGSYVRVEASTGMMTLRVDGVVLASSWLEDANRAIVLVRPAIGPAQSCYALVDPPSYERLKKGELMGLASLSGELTPIADVVGRGAGASPLQLYGGRISRFSWIAASFVAALGLEILRRSRRSEIALYLATGSRAADVALLLMLEVLVTSAMAIAVAVFVLGCLAIGGGWERNTIAAGLHMIGKGMAALALLSGMLAALATSSRDSLAGLKDR